MADNHFDLTMVWDNLGGAVRVRRNGTAQVLDPATNTPLTVVENGVSTTVVHSDAQGLVSFVAQQPTVKLSSGGMVMVETSSEAATAGASNVAAAQAAQAAAATSASSASTSASSAAASLATIPVAPAPTGGNDQTSLQTFLDANPGKPVQMRANASYSVTGTLNGSAGHDIDMRGATITQAASNTPIFTATALNGFTVRNGKFVGKATDYADSTTSYPAAVIRATTGSKNVRLLDSDTRGFAGAAVYASGVTGLRVTGNTIVGVGNGGGAGTFVFTAGTSKDNCGVIMDGTCTKVWIRDNEISYCAQGVLGGVNTDVVVAGNDIHDIGGQHGVYLNNTVRLKMTGNTVRNVASNGLKVQLSTSGNGDCTEVLIQGNITGSSGGSGIHCTLSPTAGADRFKRIAIVDNIVTNVGVADGIMLQNADGFRIEGNIVRTTQGTGIRLDDSLNGSICDNLTRDTYDQGIRVNGSVTTSPVAGDSIRIARNRVIEPAVNNGAATEFGISTSGCGNLSFIDNWITDANGNMRYGMYVAGGTQTTMEFIDNRASGATDYGFRGVAATAARAFRGNAFSGTIGATLNPPTGFTAVASPASDTSGTKAAIDAIRAILTANNLTP